MNWNEGMIARAISQQTLARKCVVLVDNCNWTGHECDVLGVTTDLRIIDVEVKISRADLKADAKKSKWWNRTFLGFAPREEIKNEAGRVIGVSQQSLYDEKQNEWPRRVWKHYYALPAEIWKPDLLDCLPSRDAYRLKPEQVMDIARLANLRMWEAYSRRDTAFSDLNARLQTTATEASGGGIPVLSRTPSPIHGQDARTGNG